jgi:hypothetical protein
VQRKTPVIHPSKHQRSLFEEPIAVFAIKRELPFGGVHGSPTLKIKPVLRAGV